MFEEAGIHVPEPARLVNRAHLNVVHVLPDGAIAKRVPNIQDAVLQVALVGLEDHLDDVVDLASSGDLPLFLTLDLKTFETGDGEPVLLGAVDGPIGKL